MRFARGGGDAAPPEGDAPLEAAGGAGVPADPVPAVQVHRRLQTAAALATLEPPSILDLDLDRGMPPALHCRQCGRAAPADARFCPQCGAALPA
jgi:hypothetical protein